MLRSLSTKLNDRIVEYLAAYPAQKVSQICEMLAKKGEQYTVQAVYCELRRLQRSGVVVRNAAQYSLDLTWLLELNRFAETARDLYLDPKHASLVPPPAGAKIAWHFRNLLKLDDFWVQLMWMLFLREERRRMFSWAPHPWFYFAQAARLEQFYDAVQKRKRRFNLVVGGNTYLDRQFAATVSPELYDVTLDPDAFTDCRQIHYMTIGDFIITVHIDKRMSQAIDKLFQSVDSQEKLNFRSVFNTLNGAATIRLIFENNANKAKRLLARFLEIFPTAATDL